MRAARAQPGEMPLADQQPGRSELLLLRERGNQRIALLPGARAHCISVGRSAAGSSPAPIDASEAGFQNAKVKMLREYGFSVIEDDAGPAMIEVTPGEATE